MQPDIKAQAAINAAVMQGRDPVEAKARTKKYAEAFQKTGFIGYVDAYQMASAIDQLSEPTDDEKDKIAAIAPAMFLHAHGR